MLLTLIFMLLEMVVVGDVGKVGGVDFDDADLDVDTNRGIDKCADGCVEADV